MNRKIVYEKKNRDKLADEIDGTAAADHEYI